MSSIFRIAKQNLDGAPVQTQPAQQSTEAPMEQRERQTSSIFQRAQELPPSAPPQTGPQRIISGVNEAKRIGTGLGARAFEAASGSYGDLASLPRDYIVKPSLEAAQKGVEKISPAAGKVFEKTATMTQKINPLGQLPTTEEFRGTTKKLTGEKYEPKSEGEKFAQEFTGDVASFITPGPGGKAKTAVNVASKVPQWVQKAKPLLRGLGIVGAAHGAEKGATALGASEETGKAIKTGTMIALSMFEKNGAKNLSDKKYKEASRHLPQNALADSTHIENAIDEVKKRINKGNQKRPWKIHLREQIDELQKKIAYGEISVEEGQEFLQDLGDAVTDWDLPRGVREKADPWIKKLRKSVSDTLDNYGKTNPKWHKEWKDAQEIRTAIHKGEGATRFIQRVAKDYGLKGIGTALGGTAYHAAKVGLAPAAAKTVAAAAAGGGGGYAALKGYEVLKRIMHSPVLRKYYLQLFQDATKENAKSVARDLKKIDHELEQSESSEE